MKIVFTPFRISYDCRFIFGFFFLFVFFSVRQLYAQQPLRALTFHSFGIDQGLSQGFVSDIKQDNRGFLWVATGDGLNRYDGYKFIVYHHDRENPNSIISDDLTCVYQDVKGRIWIGTRNSGVDLFNPEDNTFEHFQHNAGPSLRSNSVQEITGDKNGVIWIRTREGIDRMELAEDNSPNSKKGKNTIRNRASFTHIKIDQQTEINKKRSNPEAVFIDSQDRVFLTTFDKVWQLFFNTKTNEYRLKERYRFVGADPQFVPEIIEDKQGKRFLLNNGDITQFNDYEFNNPKKIYAYDPYQIRTVIDKDHNLWLVENNGITLLNLNTGTAQKVASNTPGQGRAASSIKDFYCDRSGVVWIGSGGHGLLKYDPEAELFHHILPGKVVYQIIVDKSDQIYTSNFNVIRLKKEQAPQVSRFLDFALLKREYPNIDITSFGKDTGDYAYFGVKGNLLKYNLKTRTTVKIPLPFKNINAIPFPIYCDHNSNVWMGYKGFLLKFNPSSKVFKKFDYPPRTSFYDYDFLQQIYQDGSLLWLGSTNGLFSFDMNNESMHKSYSYDPNDNSTLSNNYILSLKNDFNHPQKYLWVGTKGGGLNRLDKQSGHFIKFDTKNGLPNNVIYGILPDRQGKIWLSTNKGLSRFDPALALFQNFYVDDGLQSNEFNRYAAGQTSEGLLIFGGMNGINYFDPQNIRPLGPPEVAFTEFRLFNKPVIPGEENEILKVSIDSAKEIKLRYNQNVVTFQFAAMDYRKPGNLRYRYIMEGFDKDFLYAGTAREATYSNLDPGEYTFKVQANYSKTGWGNRYTSIKLIIIPPWYKTWWFYALSVIATISLFYGFHIFRLAQLGRVNILRNRIAMDLHDEVGSSLSTIAIYSKIVHEQNSITSFNREPLLRKITDNATEIMESMSDIVWNIHDKNDSFDSIFSRMREHAYHLFEAKGYILHFDFNDILLKKKISMEKRRDFYLIYKEALNNVAKYACGNNIWISLSSQDGLILLVIADDGVGFDPLLKSEGNGLSNMAHRAKTLNGKINVISAPNQGTRVELIF